MNPEVLRNKYESQFSLSFPRTVLIYRKKFVHEMLLTNKILATGTSKPFWNGGK